MTVPAHVKAMLDVLCAYYSDRDGQPRKLNAVQIVVYADGLARFDEVQLERAARTWMRQSKFFPALSDLLAILEPPVDVTALAHLAWAEVESAIRNGGIYRGARFQQWAVGEAVRQTFGTWAAACSFEADSPGWAIRRQTFLAIFPTLLRRPEGGSVTLRGLHRDAEPYVVGLIEGLPAPAELGEGDPLSRQEAAALLADIRTRALTRRP